MTARRVYLSTTIPYVNSRAHVGHALELVQADVLARHHRRIGDEVRLQSGTDDNSLKNVLAAEAEGISTRELVNRNASAFAGLREHLSLSFDDFIRTSSDPRHRPGVERLWRACQASGDLYRKTYEGLYCVGCEQFYTEAELIAGNCPEHGTPPQLVAEENWFFRLSRYAEQLHDLISSGRLRIEPASRRNEVLGFIAGGLEDFSASRSVARARGWGIGVPGDPSQVIYVWWDALGNYVTSLNFGASRYGAPGARATPTTSAGGSSADRRVHVVGKGVLRFHAVYWPAILLSAGQPLPTEIFVHDYLTVDGRKISKSAAGGTAGGELTRLRSPRLRRRRAALVAAARRAASWRHRLHRRQADRAGPTRTWPTASATSSTGSCRSLILTGTGSSGPAPPARDQPLARRGGATGGMRARPARTRAPADDLSAARTGRRRGGLRGASRRRLQRCGQRWPGSTSGPAASAVWQIVEQANRYVEATAPWHLARAERAGDTAAGQRLDQVLGALLAACQVLAAEIWPFLPDLAARVAAACNDFGGTLPKPQPVFPRIDVLPDGERGIREHGVPAEARVRGARFRRERRGPARTGPAHEREGGRAVCLRSRGRPGPGPAQRAPAPEGQRGRIVTDAGCTVLA